MQVGNQTIIKDVVLPIGWDLDDEAGLKAYLYDLYHANDSISSLFDDANVKVLSMKTHIEIEVEQLPPKEEPSDWVEYD